MHADCQPLYITREMRYSRSQKETDKRDDATDHPGHPADLVVDVRDDVGMAAWTVGASWLVAVRRCAHHDRRRR